MNETYLCNRIQDSLEMAGSAADSASRLVHFDLAGRYSLLAAKFRIGSSAAEHRPCEHGASSFHRLNAPELRKG